MKVQPLVTVGVPAYNRPVTLERTLTSIVNQTYKNLEIIVSDNCSTDKNVQSVIQKFVADKRIKYCRQPVNKGPIYNFNFILENATGDFILRVADDDWIDDNYVESCLTFMLDNPGYTSAYGMAKIFSLQREFLAFDAEIDMIDEKPAHRIIRYLDAVQYNGSFSGLLSKELSPNAFIKNKLAIDWIIVCRIAFLGKYKMLSNTHVNISAGGDSQSIDHLTATYQMPSFIRSFPYFSIAINIFSDIVWGSKVYRKMNLFKRLKLGANCFLIVCKKHKVRQNLKPGLKKYLVFKKNDLETVAKRIFIKSDVA